jgi:hypothetical protein
MDPIITSDGTIPRQALDIVPHLIRSANYVCGAAIIVPRRIAGKTDTTRSRVYNYAPPIVASLVSELMFSSEAESRKGLFSCAIEDRFM